MDRNKKRMLYAAGVLLALVVAYGLFWYLVPWRSYKGYEAAMSREIDTEIEYPTIFGLRGHIRMFVNDYSALEIVPGVFGGADLYVLFAGMSEDYRIPVDRELIPLDTINEECEILLDQSRGYMLEYLAWAEENWGF